MRKRLQPFPPSAIPTEKLQEYADDWYLDSEIRQLSPNTIDNRRRYVNKLDWFLKKNDLSECGVRELKKFIHYITAEADEGGRWENQRFTGKVKASTVATYHRNIRAFFSWLVKEGIIEESPMEAIPAPVCRADQIQPFTEGQIKDLLAAAKSDHKLRDKAILLFLLDTGARASELCNLNRSEVDLRNRRCTVLGKGNKRRELYFSEFTQQALTHYLRQRGDDQDGLFLSERGGSLKREGLLQLIQRLGKKAGIEVVRCSPHTFRHTHAIEFLRSGGNTFSLQLMLGHTSLAMTNRYVALAQADIEEQHRMNSPVMRLMKKQ
jgi:site-specific recombinase XerD